MIVVPEKERWQKSLPFRVSTFYEDGKHKRVHRGPKVESAVWKMKRGWSVAGTGMEGEGGNRHINLVIGEASLRRRIET